MSDVTSTNKDRLKATLATHGGTGAIAAVSVSQYLGLDEMRVTDVDG
jgi:hypothetical protein